MHLTWDVIVLDRVKDRQLEAFYMGRAVDLMHVTWVFNNPDILSVTCIQGD